MTREEEIKAAMPSAGAAIVVTPEAIAFVSPELHQASEHLGTQLCLFVDFVQSLEPKLQRFEATQLAAAFLENLPDMCQQSPGIIHALKENAQFLMDTRK